jgi:hypothetical protein
MFNKSLLKKTILLGLVYIVSASTSLVSQFASNQCTSFSVSPGTGCAWMCNYCANSLGTSNYYFTTPVCTYQTGGCVGNPNPGVQYTCCST